MLELSGVKATRVDSRNVTPQVSIRVAVSLYSDKNVIDDGASSIHVTVKKKKKKRSADRFLLPNRERTFPLQPVHGAFNVSHSLRTDLSRIEATRVDLVDPGEEYMPEVSRAEQQHASTRGMPKTCLGRVPLRKAKVEYLLRLLVRVYMTLIYFVHTSFST